MKVLAFESSTKLGGVALIENGVCLEKKESFSQKSHSEVLHSFTNEILINQKLTLQEIDIFACGVGPGSFTGIRVALNTAKTFAYVFNKPIVGIDSLTNLAYQNRTDESPVLCLINAYKNMSYYGLFSFEFGWPKVLKGPSAIPMKDIKTLLGQKVHVVGDGYTTYEKFLPESVKSLMVRATSSFDDPTAESLGLLAEKSANESLTLDWKSLKPLYIRSSEAEENQRGIVWSPLDFKE